MCIWELLNVTDAADADDAHAEPAFAVYVIISLVQESIGEVTAAADAEGCAEP